MVVVDNSQLVMERDAAIAELRRARGAGSTETVSEACQAERRVIRLRDAFIAALRENPQASDVRRRLELTNMALSLIQGIEYPASGKPRDDLEEAANLLAELLL